MMKVVTSFLFFFALAVNGAPNEDLIMKLPGIDPQPTFKQYSGYLQGSTDNIQLHYWFVEANIEAGKKNDLPLVLWLNGGPGCSSMEGFLAENGPYTVLSGAKLEYNPYSWSNVANMLFLEAPAGVGYSYANDGNVTTGDNLTAKNNLAALESFFKKFPEHAHRDFYVSGESYGGVYVPTLANKILEGSKINLKGILVGNGLTNYDYNDNSLLYFANYHGFVERKTWQTLIESCCEDRDREMCQFTKNKSSKCRQLVTEIDAIINTGFNIYNILDKCYGGVKSSYELNPYTYYQIASTNLFRSNPTVLRKKEFFFKNREMLKQVENVMPNLVIPCVDDSALEEYMNNKDVLNALHIKSGLPPFSVCSEEINTNYIREYSNLTEQYKSLLTKNIKIWLYNGDMDMACNFIGQEWFVDNLSLVESKTSRQWLYTEKDNTKQIGGFIKTFDSHIEPQVKLNYLTVKGAGHMVPQDKPIQALAIFKAFLGMDIL